MLEDALLTHLRKKRNVEMQDKTHARFSQQAVIGSIQKINNNLLNQD